MKYAAFLLLFGIIFSGCIKKRSITKIAFASGYCHGECPLQAFEVDSSLSCKYYGGEWASKKGYYNGTVKQEFWDTLVNQISVLPDTVFKEWQGCYDFQDMEIIVHFGNKKKMVSGIEGCIPKSVEKVISGLYWAHKYADLISQKDTILFETSLQYPRRVSTVKFPPVTSPK